MGVEDFPLATQAEIVEKWGAEESIEDQTAHPMLSALDYQVEVDEKGIVRARAWIFVSEVLEAAKADEPYHAVCDCIYTMRYRFTIRAYHYKFSRVNKHTNPASWKQVLRIHDEEGETPLLASWVNWGCLKRWLHITTSSRSTRSGGH